MNSNIKQVRFRASDKDIALLKKLYEQHDEDSWLIQAAAIHHSVTEMQDVSKFWIIIDNFRKNANL